MSISCTDSNSLSSVVSVAFVLIYFLMIVILVHPVLSLVLFVSQYTQTGIINVFKMYGSLFEGLFFSELVFPINAYPNKIYKKSNRLWLWLYGFGFHGADDNTSSGIATS